MAITRIWAALLFIIVACGQAHAQSPVPVTQGTQAVKRTILQRFDVPNTNLETIVATVEFAANFKAGKHTHPGNVSAVVIEGAFYVTLDGQPEKKFGVGESILIGDGTVHDEGTKDGPTKLVAIYVVEKGKPLLAPANK